MSVIVLDSIASLVAALYLAGGGVALFFDGARLAPGNRVAGPAVVETAQGTTSAAIDRKIAVASIVVKRVPCLCRTR